MKFGMAPLAAAALLAAASHVAWATPTAEEAAQLGKTLTPYGAIKAGNADGSIPAWTGGICTPPAGYKPRNPAGGFPYVDTFAAEKPLFTITAANLAQHGDKVDEGAKEMFKRFPNFRMDVYPSHRTACYPDWVYKNTIEKVMSPKTTEGGQNLTGAQAQVPFPIAKTGYEAMWNALTKYQYPYTRQDIYSFIVDAAGRRSDTSVMDITQQVSYWINDRAPLTVDEPYRQIKSLSVWPAAQKGSGSILIQYLQPTEKDAMAWSYIPGQRRVRIAPEFKYDTVSTSSGGVLLYDEIDGFYGRMDKYNFKLIGRKEMYVMYNAWRTQMTTGEQLGTKDFANPDHSRWELHRVWVVQADLKPGERHVQKQKTFLLDEDTWMISAYWGTDSTGKLHHYMQLPIWQEYEKPAAYQGNYLIYDFNRGFWSASSVQGNPDHKQTGSVKAAAFPAGVFNPESMAGGSIR